MSVRPNRTPRLQFQWSTSTPDKPKPVPTPESSTTTQQESSPLQRSIYEAKDIVRRSRSRQLPQRSSHGAEEDIIMKRCLDGLHSTVEILEEFSGQMNDLARMLNASADSLRKSVSALTDSPYYRSHDYPHPQRLFSPSCFNMRSVNRGYPKGARSQLSSPIAKPDRRFLSPTCTSIEFLGTSLQSLEYVPLSMKSRGNMIRTLKRSNKSRAHLTNPVSPAPEERVLPPLLVQSYTPFNLSSGDRTLLISSKLQMKPNPHHSVTGSDLYDLLRTSINKSHSSYRVLRKDYK